MMIPVPQDGKPEREFPYGVNQFSITGLSNGESVTVSLKFPNSRSDNSEILKTNASDQWAEIELGSNDGDDTVTIHTDGWGSLNGRGWG
jgi:hypothetical protein